MYLVIKPIFNHLSYFIFSQHYPYNIPSVDGGWREEEFSECSEVCGSGTKRKIKHCDNPAPAGGDLCPCNDNDPNEISCNGLKSVIEEPCNEQPCESKSLTRIFLTIYFHINICEPKFNNIND